MFFTKSTQSTQNWKHQSVEITEVWHRWSGPDPLAGFTERKPDKSYPKMKILGSVRISRIGQEIRTQNTQSKNPWNSDISRVLSGGWSGGSNTILSDFPNRSKHWKERSWRRPQGVRFSKCNSKCNHYCQRDRTKRINNDAAKGTGSMLPKLFFYWRAFVQPCNFWFNLPKWFTIKDSRF